MKGNFESFCWDWDCWDCWDCWDWIECNKPNGLSEEEEEEEEGVFNCGGCKGWNTNFEDVLADDS